LVRISRSGAVRRAASTGLIHDDRMMSATTVTTTARGSLLALAYLGFISLGLPDGLLGVGWPSMSEDFRVPRESVGFVITAGTAGYLSSSVAAGFTIARLGVGWLLAASTAMASVALAGYASSPGLALLVGCALLLGVGSGAIDSGLNAYAAANFGARHMNWLHASFGFGATLGPLVMTSVLAAGLAWRWGYGTVAAAQAVLTVAFLLTARSWASHRPPPDPAAAPPGARSELASPAARAEPTPGVAPGEVKPAPVRVMETLALPAVWLGAAAFALYVAVEIAAGLWAFTLLTQGRGMGDSAAGVCVAAYWGSLFVGRVVLGVVAERVGTRPVLLTSLGGMITGALLVSLPAPGWVAVGGLMLIGLAAAPVFPLMTLTTADRVGQRHADRAIGVQVGACGLGGALLPAGIGVLLSRVDVEALGPALAVLSIALLGLYLASARRPAAPQP
jgi:fucose permease